jgi:hypothetical protein
MHSLPLRADAEEDSRHLLRHRDHLLMDRAAALRFAGNAPVVTDDLPHVEFTGPKAIDLTTTAQNYLAVTEHASFALPYLAASDDPAFAGVAAALETLFEGEPCSLVDGAGSAGAAGPRAGEGAGFERGRLERGPLGPHAL